MTKKILKQKYILGLDIGITSVGYGLINNDTREVIGAGVRLFPEANVENNEGRRFKRGARRLKRRRIHRLERVKNLLVDYNLIDKNQTPKSTNPYEIRVRGLDEALSKEEFAIALLHIAKRRGIHNVAISIDEQEVNNTLSTKDQLKKNAKDLEDKYICELQLERLIEQKKVRGESNRFKTEDFVREAKQLCQTQKQFHNIDNHFIEQYIKLVATRRGYYEGPGKSSPYGWEGDLKKWYEMLMGRCTYFPEELRSVKHAYSADLFNALNDLNNLVFSRDESPKLAYHEKYHIIENVFKQKKTPTLKQIAKEIGVNEGDIKGYRINKSGKPQFTSFKLYHDLKNIFEQSSYLNDESLMDEIAQILTIYQDEESIKEALNQLPEMLYETEKDKISHLTGYTGTHRLSLKCIQLLIDELWESSDNQMQLFTKLNLKPRKVDLGEANRIPTSMVDEFVLSPVVKRSFIQSIKVINAIIEQYGLPEDIIVELAREKNSEEKKRIIKKLQKQNEATRKKVEKVLKESGNENAKNMIEKIKLHDSQEGKCLYSLEAIPLGDLLSNPTHYEVDHIIPRSVAFDNSFNNKVLVKKEENSKKANRSPYQYLNSNESNISYTQFKQHILNLSKAKDRIPRKKRDYLLEERDINKFEVQKEFINRNLVDTRYASRELTTLLKAYFNANDLAVKVKTINGGFTNYLRKVWKFKKDRNEGYKHHAEDALVIANADFLFKNQKSLTSVNRILEKPTLEQSESKYEVKTDDEYRELFEVPKQVQQIKDFKNYKFSHRVDKKPNRQLMNDTLYSTRNIEGVTYTVLTLKDIYAKNNEKVKKKITDQPEKFLMYQHDPKTFKKIQTVIQQYAEEKNPLAKYYEETGEYIKKYAKNEDGPVIKKLKYLDNKLGSHLDISDNYINPKNKLVKLSMKSFRFDVYQSERGYKMVPISYIDVLKKDNYFYIPQVVYEEKKQHKNIEEQDKFVGSFYNNDLISLNDELYKIIGVNSAERNIIELDMVEIRYMEYCNINNITKEPRIKKTISKNTKSIEKYTTDILGNMYHTRPSKKPQLIFKRGMA